MLAFASSLTPCVLRSDFRTRVRHGVTSSLAHAPLSSQSRATVLVAGATGSVGSRLVRLLAANGYAVRAASRDSNNVVRTFDLGDTGSEGSEEKSGRGLYPPMDKRLITPVALDVTKASSDELVAAIGSGTGVVVSALGAPFSLGRVDGEGIAKLMTAASKVESVRQMLVVSSLGVGRPLAFPAALLNLFAGVLFFKEYSEKVTRERAAQSNKSYVIVRPGGMEVPTDGYDTTHKVKVFHRDCIARGFVSSLQIARLMLACIEHPDCAHNKTVEVIADPLAPRKDLVELMDGIASET